MEISTKSFQLQILPGDANISSIYKPGFSSKKHISVPTFSVVNLQFYYGLISTQSNTRT